jgi:hypothetical protein
MDANWNVAPGNGSDLRTFTKFDAAAGVSVASSVGGR